MGGSPAILRDPEAAAHHVRRGGLLAYPTETVWGLGADASSEAAVERLRAWKGREAHRPLSILVAEAADVPALGVAWPATAERLGRAFWPGPLTLVLACAPGRFARGVARADGAVGVRCSPDPTARALARAVARAGAGPLTATSLNRSGEPPVRSAEGAARVCAERRPGDPDPPALLASAAGDAIAPASGDADPTGRASRLAREETSLSSPLSGPGSPVPPSTVVDLTGPPGAYRVIRPGAVAAADLAAALGESATGRDQKGSARTP